MKLNDVRRFSTYVSTFYHSEYITGEKMISSKLTVQCVFYTSQVSVAKQKAIKLSNSNFRLEPTPQCDAHISAERAKLSDTIISAWNKSQVLPFVVINNGPFTLSSFCDYFL